MRYKFVLTPPLILAVRFGLDSLDIGKPTLMSEAVSINTSISFDPARVREMIDAFDDACRSLPDEALAYLESAGCR